MNIECLAKGIWQRGKNLALVTKEICFDPAAPYMALDKSFELFGLQFYHL